MELYNGLREFINFCVSDHITKKGLIEHNYMHYTVWMGYSRWWTIHCLLTGAFNVYINLLFCSFWLYFCLFCFHHCQNLRRIWPKFDCNIGHVISKHICKHGFINIPTSNCASYKWCLLFRTPRWFGTISC